MKITITRDVLTSEESYDRTETIFEVLVDQEKCLPELIIQIVSIITKGDWVSSGGAGDNGGFGKAV